MKIKIILSVIIISAGLFSEAVGAERRTEPMLITGDTVIDRDLEFDQTAFVIRGDNITLDLNGHTVKFNNMNFCEVPNREFEEWTGSTPNEWTVTGTAERRAATYFGSFDLFMPNGGTIRSSPIALRAGKTYVAFAYVKASAGSMTLRLLDTNNAELGTETRNTSQGLTQGFASVGNTDSNIKYKPSADMNVILELQAPENSRVGMVDIKPYTDYGVAAGADYNTAMFPDLIPNVVNGNHTNITIRNGKLVQGDGKGVRCAGILAGGVTWTIDNVDIEMAGLNADGIRSHYGRNFSIRDSSIKFTSAVNSNFNRMHPPAGIYFFQAAGDNAVSNCVLENMPEMGIAAYAGSDHSFVFTDNDIRQNETVTEGYGIAICAVVNVEIARNIIHPVKGRGILIDVADGTRQVGNVSIHDNDIDVYEKRNFEYGPEGMEVAGIRLRNWGQTGSFLRGIRIFNNKIIARTDPDGVHGAAGININASAALDDIEIYGNTVTALSSRPYDSSNIDFAAAVLLQNAIMNGDARLLIHDNTLKSNHQIVRFGSNDGETTFGMLIERNTFKRPSNPAFPIMGRSFSMGFWTGDETANILADNTCLTQDMDPRVRDNIVVSGTDDGTKELLIGRHRLNVSVTASSEPAGDAVVTILDSSRNALMSKTTGPSGALVFYTPEVYYSGTGSSVTRRTYNDCESFVLVVEKPGFESLEETLDSVCEPRNIEISLDGSKIPYPVIVTHPDSQSVQEGQTATFTVSATGTGTLTYQWQRGTGSAFSDIPGATGSSYSFVTAQADNGAWFRCVVTNDNGTATSKAAMLTVNRIATPPGRPKNLRMRVGR